MYAVGTSPDPWKSSGHGLLGKAIRKARGLSQYKLAEVSSRTYVSKLERGQSSPTLEMMSTLSSPLGVSPLALVALTLAAESGQSISSLIMHAEREIDELSQADVLKELKIPPDEPWNAAHTKASSKSRRIGKTLQQTEFCFAE